MRSHKMGWQVLTTDIWLLTTFYYKIKFLDPNEKLSD